VTEHYDVIIVGTGAHGEDPTEGHFSKQYPWPAVSHEPRIQQISDAPLAGPLLDQPNVTLLVNPALTAMANAIRVGEHLLSRTA
jgi:hypothetical protein